MENNILIFTLCTIPSLLLMLYIYTKDKIEKEPLSLLITLFIGGIISSIISLSLSLTLKSYFPFLNLPYNNLSPLQVLFKVLIVISLTEETSKWIINYICTWKTKHFKHNFDQIVYSSFISLGFATFENILYGFTYNSNVFQIILLRGLISVPSHLVFGIYMGYYLLLAKKTKKSKLKKWYLIKSLVIPISLHFIYNTLLITQNNISFTIFIIYVILIYIFCYLKITELSSTKKQEKI